MDLNSSRGYLKNFYTPLYKYIISKNSGKLIHNSSDYLLAKILLKKIPNLFQSNPKSVGAMEIRTNSNKLRGPFKPIAQRKSAKRRPNRRII